MSAAVIDIVIIAILGISVVYGIYHGFLQSVLSVVCCIASFFIAAQAAPAVTGLLMNNSTVTSFLSTGTDALGQVSDYQLASQQVSGPVDQSLVDLVLANVDLPEPVEKLIGENLRTGAFASLHINTVNEYVQRTIITTALNVICYILCFAVSYFVLALLGSLLKHVFDFPLLKMLDWLCGGVLGLVRGGLIVYVLFLILPVVLTVLSPANALETAVQESRLAGLFSGDGLFARVITGR